MKDRGISICRDGEAQVKEEGWVGTTNGTEP